MSGRCYRCRRERFFTTVMRGDRVVCDECAAEAGCHRWRTLDEEYRNGGSLVEDRRNGRDLVTEMAVARKRPDVLASQLRSMGVSEHGDEVLDE